MKPIQDTPAFPRFTCAESSRVNEMLDTQLAHPEFVRAAGYCQLSLSGLTASRLPAVALRQNPRVVLFLYWRSR